ncbi:Ribosomal protein S18 acetylase RimI [Halovenus aranensis]|uniref:Ribosomal protein S18 acetylase RimI n=1 Tax=Halovenus aranensis TaxID=890420 RepID=A0A1G8SPM0_9EURY|nr:GNAT family N-acetyltransferase [Halovenus aranensis]SDJ31209.1 Ribosomal protein S18 acetylase RimI [Halovenus aranensis]
MQVRDAVSHDSPALRDVARRSLEASYPLDQHTIAAAVDEWYAEERLAERLAHDEQLLLVVEEDGQVVGFADAEQTGDSTAELYWLHVDPSFRAESYGERLFTGVQERFTERGVPNLLGRVLAVNDSGGAFYERHGMEQVGQEPVDIDGTEYAQEIYAAAEGETRAVDVDGDTFYIDHTATERGSLGQFHLVYAEEDGNHYGYWCANCESLANAMDAMGRIQCDGCGNSRKPTRWDAAYL